MCYVLTGQSHCCNQLFFGLVLGAAAGYFSHIGLLLLGHLIGYVVLVATVLDHLTVLLVPWGYRGPGAEPDRFAGGAAPPVTAGLVGIELLCFLRNNAVLGMAFAMAYALCSGYVVVTKAWRIYLQH